MRKYQRFGVETLPTHRYLQCFVPAASLENLVNTSMFCDQPNKTAVIYNVFCFGLINTGIRSVLCLFGLYKTRIPSKKLSPSRGRNAHGHVARASLCKNLQEKCQKPDGAPLSSTGLYTYRTNPSVWTHCLGNIKTPIQVLHTVPKGNFSWTRGIRWGWQWSSKRALGF